MEPKKQNILIKKRNYRIIEYYPSNDPSDKTFVLQKKYNLMGWRDSKKPEFSSTNKQKALDKIELMLKSNIEKAIELHNTTRYPWKTDNISSHSKPLKMAFRRQYGTSLSSKEIDKIHQGVNRKDKRTNRISF
ncbi:hypothetical protein HN014_22525 (plasmid) [Aquimarina sp. TRL1]|uniref:hypothetical protein n=1 Tax=Aquimarina sp. (strain TRL1) TaxID=2736252 RepID=UPI00158DBC3F|nr:hypothetical protein [Aquimarina sp. TRL1]QKX07778.1 hypothetical protein HN014_22525 [Aquimarina sp. TRL1]